MSISMLIGKSPKIHIKCGKCSYWFSRRFDLSEFPNPIAKCNHCGTINETSLRYGWVKKGKCYEENFVKKHLGILGSKPSAVTIRNVEMLYCNNCNCVPECLSYKEWFRNNKSFDTVTCDWWICEKCYTPLKIKW